jgi:hypothetical protein
MYNEKISKIINKLTLDASNINKSPSYVMVEAYDKEKFNKNILVKCNVKYEDAFKYWFNDSNLTDKLFKSIKEIVGDPINIYEVTKKEFKKIEKDSMFYFLEDVYVVEYNNYYIYYLIGNNE